MECGTASILLRGGKRKAHFVIDRFIETCRKESHEGLPASRFNTRRFAGMSCIAIKK